MLVTMTHKERALLHCLAVAAHVVYPFRDAMVSRIVKLFEQHVQQSQASRDFSLTYVGYSACTNRYCAGGALLSINIFERAVVNTVPTEQPICYEIKRIDRRLQYQMRKAMNSLNKFEITEVNDAA
jgi:hypothetical protein